MFRETSVAKRGTASPHRVLLYMRVSSAIRKEIDNEEQPRKHYTCCSAICQAKKAESRQSSKQSTAAMNLFSLFVIGGIHRQDDRQIDESISLGDKGVRLGAEIESPNGVT